MTKRLLRPTLLPLSACKIFKFILAFTLALISMQAGPRLFASELAAAPNVFQAIRSGNIAALKTFVKQGAAGVRDESGNTPLMAAGLYGNTEAVQLLLKAGADVQATNRAGATALLRAATFEEKAALLVAAGASVNARSALGNTPLHLAARKPGNHRTVRLLLDHGAQANATNMFGATPLMAAAAAGDLESARLLLERGADINARPNMNGDGFIWGGGRTPLMWAAFNGDQALVKLLLERGAKVDQFTLVGGALAQAAWGNHAGPARLLLEAGAPVDQRDLVANYTPLHWAASSEHGSADLVKLLLARGADVNSEGGQPVDNFLGATETPLTLARKRGQSPIVQALLNAGAPDVATSASDRSSKASTAAAIGFEGTRVLETIQRALPPLSRTAELSVNTFQRHASRQNCISCHQQQLPLAALSLAHARKFPTDRTAVSRQLGLMKDFISSTSQAHGSEAPALEINLQATFHPEPAIVAGYASMVLDLEHEPASAATDAMVHQLATMQHTDGHWSWNLPRPPIQASDIGATALAVHTIKHFTIPARKRELDERLQRARNWLAKSSTETTEELTHQLLGLAWAGESSGRLKKLSTALLREQRADGGWSQLAGLESDAYATGQALYALLEGGGIPSTDAAIRKGIDYLVRTQGTDGTWHVRRRAHPFQPPMDSGFSHGADGWISSAGSSWAVLALVTSLDPSQSISAGSPLAVAADASHPAIPAKTTSSAAGGPVEFGRDIQPILERSCVACHSGERAKGGFVVTDRAAFLRGGARGEPAIVPGQPEASPLLRIVQDQIEDLEMPPLAKRGKYPQLSQTEIEKLKTWARQGAP
jgi:ankyrin repeat protein/mono/diheme cytochrome c family protein